LNHIKIHCAHAIVFQSRVGKLPWTEPNLFETIEQWAQKGHKNIVIAMPSFVADCIETLEEIGVRFKEQWLKRVPDGSVTVVPCVNHDPKWIQAVSNWIEETQRTITSTSHDTKVQ
ncbi:MAG: ferrochelatase, partial [Gammaproteobacteria bacterium]|nr:ferrochelatase [Gammaproteobacteria bacterium]